MSDVMGMEGLGNHAILRPTNIEKVSQLTGYSEEELKAWLEKAEAKGYSKVRIPLVPPELRES